jgi:hypothetical protein
MNSEYIILHTFETFKENKEIIEPTSTEMYYIIEKMNSGSQKELDYAMHGEFLTQSLQFVTLCNETKKKYLSYLNTMYWNALINLYKYICATDFEYNVDNLLKLIKVLDLVVLKKKYVNLKYFYNNIDLDVDADNVKTTNNHKLNDSDINNYKKTLK